MDAFLFLFNLSNFYFLSRPGINVAKIFAFQAQIKISDSRLKSCYRFEISRLLIKKIANPVSDTKDPCKFAGCSHGCEWIAKKNGKRSVIENNFGKRSVAYCKCPPGYRLDDDKKTCIGEFMPKSIIQ